MPTGQPSIRLEQILRANLPQILYDLRCALLPMEKPQVGSEGELRKGINLVQELSYDIVHRA